MLGYLRIFAGLVRPRPSRGSDALDQLHDPNLRLRVGVDVPLRGAKVRVPGQHLHVPEGSPHCRDLARRIGYKSATAAVTRTAHEPDMPVPALKHIHDRLRRRRQRSFGAYDVGASGKVYLVPILYEGFPYFVAQRDHPAGLSLAGRIEQEDCPADFSLRVVRHPPGEAGYLLGPEA